MIYSLLYLVDTVDIQTYSYIHIISDHPDFERWHFSHESYKS